MDLNKLQQYQLQINRVQALLCKVEYQCTQDMQREQANEIKQLIMQLQQNLQAQKKLLQVKMQTIQKLSK